ncbi:hypothetical protein JB92DRAFT_1567669 [Gautieria morchelliformis]|nr:hypothetical protein JB92DRAFT_1567669 [Gautieria morchelliformis]
MDPDQLIPVLGSLQVITVNNMAAAALLLYEILITSGQEIKYIWSTSWSKISVLHVLIRYYALGYLIVNAYGISQPSLFTIHISNE